MAEAERDMTAAELALGVLDGEERASAMRRILSDPDFARDVERWRDHFGSLFTQWPEQEPPMHLGERIERAIFPKPPSRRFWPALAITAGAIAAVLAGILLLQPERTAPQQSVPTQSAVPAMVASLVTARSGAPVPAVYDAARQEIHVAAATFAPPGRSAELWLIPADGVPRSLGLISEGTRTSVRLSPEISRLIDAKATLAVSNEPQGGSPTRQPTGAILASGSLIPV
jgi:anti-sigma-K factor RskA